MPQKLRDSDTDKEVGEEVARYLAWASDTLRNAGYRKEAKMAHNLWERVRRIIDSKTYRRVR